MTGSVVGDRGPGQGNRTGYFLLTLDFSMSNFCQGTPIILANTFSDPGCSLWLSGRPSPFIYISAHYLKALLAYFCSLYLYASQLFKKILQYIILLVIFFSEDTI